MSTPPPPTATPLGSATDTSNPPEPLRPDAAPEAQPSSRAGRWGFAALALALVGFLLWASIAPLNSGVPTMAQVTVDTKRRPVQHLSGGIVQTVLVREGEVVQVGQPLIKLNDAMARANYESVRQRYLGMQAVQNRLQAEHAGASSIAFAPELQSAANTDPQIQQQLAIQQQLLLSRRSALQAELAAINESINGQQASIVAIEGMRGMRQQQLALLQQELGHISTLVAEGFAPRNRQLELERNVAELQSSLLELHGSLQRARSAIAELRQRALARQQQQRLEIETQLTQASLEVQSDTERYNALRDELQRSHISAPAAGQVVGLQVPAAGGVIQPGAVLMDIVPVGEPLLLDARIEPHLIDRVRTGQRTNVRFTTFMHQPQLVVEGEVVSLSKDVLTDRNTGASFYLARVQVTPEGMNTLGQNRMQPGMPAEVLIVTGERTLLTYLLGPLLRRVAMSMTEE